MDDRMDDGQYGIVSKVATAKLPTNHPSNAILITQKYIIIGTKDGSLLLYDHNNILLNTIPGVISGSIDALKELNVFVIVIQHDGYQVVLYDLKNQEILERLPFRDITCVEVLGEDKLAIATRNLILQYQWDNCHKSLDLVHQYKCGDKIVSFTFAGDHRRIIMASSSNFYSLDMQHPNPDPVRLTFNSKYSLFNQRIDVKQLSDDQFLLSKGHNAQIIDKNLKIIKEFQWDSNSKSIEFFSPFLLFCTGNHIYIKDFNHLTENLQIIDSNKLQSISIFKQNIASISQTGEINMYEMGDFDKMVTQMALWDTEQAIDILKQFDVDDYPNKFLKLRDLQIERAIKYFQKGKQYSKAIDIFTTYIAPPIKVIQLYPEFIRGEVTRELDESEVDKNSLYLLAQFLTDSRRKLNRLLSSEDQRIPYEDGLITVDFFTDSGKCTIDEVKVKLDTTLFLTYSIINQGLIGSLVRVDNDCDSDTIIRVLKSKGMNSVLIDYYFKKGLHKDALNLLNKLYPFPEHEPTELVKYLQRLRNDDLPIILQYAEIPTVQNEKYAVDIFIDSPYADSFKRNTVLEFFVSLGSLTLQQLYLEFIILELRDKSQYFNNKLVEIYWTFWKEENANEESKYFDKLKGFLLTGHYDLSYINNKLFKELQDPTREIYILETIVLTRLKRYEDVIDIQINKIKENEASIDFMVTLYSTDDPANLSKILIHLVKMLLKVGGKDSIIKVLTVLLNTSPSHVPIMEIFKLFNKKSSIQFSAQELNKIIIKYLRNERSTLNRLQLTKSLYSVKTIDEESEKLKIESQYFEVVNNAQKCKVCQLYITNNSMLAYLPQDGDVIHLGCLKAHQTQIESSKPPKLKTISLKDYVAPSTTW